MERISIVRTHDMVAKGLLASRPIQSSVAAYAQWQYTVRHIAGELSLRDRKFNRDSFYQKCGYSE